MHGESCSRILTYVSRGSRARTSCHSQPVPKENKGLLSLHPLYFFLPDYLVTNGKVAPMLFSTEHYDMKAY